MNGILEDSERGACLNHADARAYTPARDGGLRIPVAE
jgi:hypothetical protein